MMSKAPYNPMQRVKNKNIKVPGKLIHTNIDVIITSKKINNTNNKFILIINF